LAALKGSEAVPYQAKSEKIYMLMQRGDSVIAPNKHPNLRMWDGMVSYLDPQEWRTPVVFSDFWHGEVCIVELPRVWKPVLMEATKSYESLILNQYGYPITGDTSKRARGYIEPSSFALLAQAQVPDFLTRYYKHKTYMPVINGDAFNQSILLDTKTVDFTKRLLRADVGQITTGSFTVGPGGGDDYPRYGGVGAAWTALGNLTGDLDFTTTGAITENASAAGTENLNGFTLSHDSDNHHNGDPTGGHIISYNFDNHGFRPEFEGAGTYRMSHQYFFRQFNNTIAYSFHLFINVAVAYNGYVNDILFDGNDKTTRGLTVADNTPRVYTWNCVGWDCSLSAFVNNPAKGTNRTENNVAHSCSGVGFDAFNTISTWRNNLGIDNGTDFANKGAATGRYNFSTDGTAAGGWGAELGNQNNVVAANCVLGVNPAVANYMDILGGGTCDGAGEANDIGDRTVCIRNRAVPGPNGTSVGAAEVAVTPTPPTPTPTPVVVGRLGGASPHRQQYWRRMMSHKLTP
jgi:hypothetical protein